MNEDSNSRLSRTSEEISLRYSATNVSTVSTVENGETSEGSNGVKLQISSNNIKREPLFVIIDSSCVSNPSSTEMLINRRIDINEAKIKKYPKHNVIPIDTPGTSKDQEHILPIHIGNFESREELQMVDINLQSDNEILLNNDDNENEPESIVLAYLRNKDIILDNDEPISTTRKKSSLLQNVPKMETILESEQFSSFLNETTEASTHSVNYFQGLSESSLDVHIPSYPGSPRSLNIGSGISLESSDDYDRDPLLKDAIEFLHRDKEFLIAAEIGDDKLLDIYIRRREDIQQVDYLGRNALHLAVCSGNIQAIKLLLRAGVNPNVKDNVGMTPLSLTLMRRPSLLVANLLFDHGAKLMPRSNPMDSGLFIQFTIMCTPTTEEENILQLLVTKGALINDPCAPGGRQALHFAAMSNNTTLIRILVSLGADMYMTNHRNETPKETAFTFNCKEAYEILYDLEETDDTVEESSSAIEITDQFKNISNIN